MNSFSKKAALLGSVAFAVFFSSAAWAQTRTFDVPSEPAVKAIPEFARQAGIQIVAPARDLKGVVTPEVKGSLDVHDALRRLLSGTGASITSDDGQTIVLQVSPKNVEAAPNSGAASGDVGGSSVETVVVTAEKREELLRDVPVPVAVLSGQKLTESNQLRIQDYYAQVPGLDFVTLSGRSTPTIAIRGVIAAGGTNPTVGIMVDDVPFGGSTSDGLGFVPPDIDPSDLARIEVLRGPQGTLYGANSMGGLLKYVTVDPSVSEFSGRVEAGLIDVQGGCDLGYNLRGALNVPIDDTLAVRVSGFVGQDPGYVDNVLTHQSDVNSTDRAGVHVAVLWQPSSNFTIKLSAIHQETDRNGDDAVNPTLGDLRQSEVRGGGVYDQRSDIFSATANYTLGTAEIVSATGYSDRHTFSNIDSSSSLGFFANQDDGVAGVLAPVDASVKKFSQELRLTMPIGDNIDWLLGGFYTHEDTLQDAIYDAADPASGHVVGTPLLTIHQPTTFQETAVFTNFTVHFTPTFDVQLGGRYSVDQQTFSTVRGGEEGATFFDPLVIPETHSRKGAFTYLLTPEWHVSPDFMIYARLASGYRPGGPNASCSATIPCQYGPDKTQNYEVGSRADLFDGVLSLDASLYYIDWSKIQNLLLDGALAYNANVGNARVQGIEFTATVHPTSGLTLTGWVAYNDAKLTSTLPAATLLDANAGDRLPYSSRFSGSLSAEQSFDVASGTTLNLGGVLSYVGDRLGAFQYVFAPTRQKLPAYTQLNLHASLQRGSWTLNAYANNIGNARGVLDGGLDKPDPSTFNYIQPRTIGLSLAKSF